MSFCVIRSLARAGIIYQKNVRCLSSSPKLVDVQVNEKTGISTVTMQRPPVNALNLELFKELYSVFTDLESDKSRGVILTSASSSVFSAGLDILEMCKPDPDRFEKFFLTAQDMWASLYGSSYPTVAAINGHSPAGGCMLAMNCEYRIMVQGKYIIGLNETKLGIVAPFWLADLYRRTIPNRTAELALTTGDLFSVDEALKIGLIDEVATDKNDAIQKAEKFLTRFAKIHPMARANTKRLLRGDAIKYLEENREEDLQTFLNYVNQPEVQKELEVYMQSLKKKLNMSLGMLRNLTKSGKLFSKNIRSLSSSAKLIDVQVNEKTGISTITMQRAPVNGLNLDLLSELNTVFNDLENQKTRGVILTSASPTVFSAGLDILEMYKPDPDRIKKFWTTLQDTWISLYGSSFPTVAAINGHSPAGGCLLAISCEYRIMVQGNYTIGLNETKLGIVAPFWFIDAYKNTISNRQAELALTTGNLFPVEEALKIGLIDEIATDKNDAIQKAEKFLSRFAKIHPMARANTKRLLREEAIKRLEENKEDDLQGFLNYVNLPQVQKGLDLYMQSLKKK